jgi:hypothetical protein
MESVRDLISTIGKKRKYKHNEKEATMNKQTSKTRNKEHGQD